MTAVLCSLGCRGYPRDDLEHSLIQAYKKTEVNMFDSVEHNVSMEDLNIAWRKKKGRKYSYSISGSNAQPRSILKRSYSVGNLPKILLPKKYTFSGSSENLESTNYGEMDSPKSPSKFVSFADDNNLKLCEVKNFVPSCDKINLWSENSIVVNDDIFFQKYDVQVKDFNPSSTKTNPCINELKLCFKEPSAEKSFLGRFKHRCVALEKCGTRGRSVIGIVLVKNIEYNKHVTIRYTTDDWKTFVDTSACYVPNSNDIDTDRFSFTLIFPKTCHELEFAIRYNTSTTEFWDNNYNRNYRVIEVDS